MTANEVFQFSEPAKMQSPALTRLVSSRSVQVLGTRPIDKLLPPLQISHSQIPDAGLGVFALANISKHAYVTEYGGQLISWATAVRRRAQNQDTHIIGLSHQIDALDSRTDDPLSTGVPRFTLAYYAENHLVGGLINDPYNSGRAANVAYMTIDHGKGYPAGFHDAGGAEPVYSSARVFLRALRNISAGEELLVDYDGTYHNIHFS